MTRKYAKKARCWECNAVPAFMLLPESGRWLCGVCAHRLLIYKRTIRTIVRARAEANRCEHCGALPRKESRRGR